MGRLHENFERSHLYHVHSDLRVVYFINAPCTVHLRVETTMRLLKPYSALQVGSGSNGYSAIAGSVKRAFCLA